ncbi:MAG: ferritin family protein [Tissierellia bacterium]|nr:ferritin family protein [Tissierellia bacterium]
MPNKYSEEVKALRQAMLNEVEGAQFYKLSADKFGNSSTRDIFLHLAEEEEKHYDYLKYLSEKLMDLDSEVELDPKSLEEEIPSPQIYNWEKANPEILSLAVSVFSIAMNMEKDSVAFYEKAREEAESEETKKLFDILIKWEQVHLEQFTNQYNVYQQEWWNEQNFAPF